MDSGEKKKEKDSGEKQKETDSGEKRKGTDASEKPNIASYLNPDILYEILFRLPPESLLRFRAVSKSFRELITDANFYRLRSTKQSSRIDGFFVLRTSYWGDPLSWEFFPRDIAEEEEEEEEEDYEEDDEEDEEDLPSLSIGLNFLFRRNKSVEDIEVLDSRNGLVLCAHHFDRCWITAYSVGDPLWKEKVRLPQPPLRPNDEAEFALVACPASTHHFKVVCLVEPREGYSFHDIQVFSSESRQWKGHDVGPPLSHYSLGRPKASNGGILFWGCLEGHVLVCDVEMERLSIISAPYAPMGRSLWVSPDGRLCCCSRGIADDYIFSSLPHCSYGGERQEDKHATEFANMVEDISTFYTKFSGLNPRLKSINLNPRHGPGVPFQVVGCQGGRWQETIFFLWIPNGLFQYRAEKRELSVVLGGLVNKFFMTHRAFAYEGSLVSSLEKFTRADGARTRRRLLSRGRIV